MSEEVQKCVEIIRKGGVILYPTDTIWGLGCDPKNEQAIEKINQIKNRDESKSYIMLVAEERQLNFYVPEIPDICYDLIDFAVRPTTIIYDNAKNVSPMILAQDGSLGIRLTKDPFCQKLCQQLKTGVVSTSANISGAASPQSFNEIEDSIKNSVDYIVNLRQNEKMTTPSSILKIGTNGEVKIIRK
ncbi:MAG: threonylcarbamoyl-AMP synthase [Crocinitomicaceae bacterium]|nr:threonylcarbamoyl-AMP synthase [Crocinitomicaceae bacterium]